MPSFQRHLPAFALFFCLLTQQSLQAQPAFGLQRPKVEYIGIEDGLPLRDITSLVQDHQGFIWLSTYIGVFRYDGYQFVPLRKLAKNGRLLPPSLTRIFMKPNGNILLLTEQQVQLFEYDPLANTVSIHPIHQTAGNLLPLYFQNFVIKNDGSFLLEMEKNGKRYLMQYSEKTGLSTFDSVGQLSNDDVYIQHDRAGNIFWGVVEAGIRRYSPAGQLLDSLQLPLRMSKKGISGFLHEFFLDSEDQVTLISPEKKLVVWDWKQHRVLTSKLPFLWLLHQPLTDVSGNTWLMVADSLLLLDVHHQLHNFSSYLKEKADFSVLKKVMVDSKNQIWVASDNGIFKLNHPGNKFSHYLSNPLPKWATTTRAFFEDDKGAVYVRCESCGSFADSAFYRIDPVSDKTELARFVSPTNDPVDLLSWVRLFYRPPGQDMVWSIGQFGIVKFDFTHRTASLSRAVDPKLLNNTSGNVAWGTTHKGEIIAGGKLSQLLLFDPATEKTRLLLPDGIGKEEEGFIKTVMEAQDGTVWVGLGQGLVQVDAKQGKILKRFDTQTHAAFLTDLIQVIFEDMDNTLWVGTFGGGLVHIFPKTGEVINYNTSNGLCNNDITAILPYKKDYLWISTFNGLSCFNKKDNSFINYYMEDGLTHNEFNRTSAFIDSKGRYYFGGMNGVNSFYPADIMKPQTPLLQLVLTNFTYYDEKKDSISEQSGGLQNLTSVILSPHTSWFQFNFALPEYINPKLNQFKTWLDGFEKDWNYQGTTPFIRYNRLPAGDYTLHIKAADSKGNWSDKELIIQITVQQVFYKKWWFILLIIGIIGAGAFALLRYRYQQRLALERMRTRIASDLHDEVGSSLSHLNLLINSLDIKTNPEIAAKGIEKSKEIMRKTASNIRDVVWAIDARRDKTGDLLDRMEDFAYDMFSAKNIAYHFSADGVNREAILNPFVRQNIYLIYKESVNNIAKHSNASDAYISLVQKGGILEMNIRDNGKSINHSKVKGQGLENMELRAQRIGGEVEIRQEENGFSVGLKVPINAR